MKRLTAAVRWYPCARSTGVVPRGLCRTQGGQPWNTLASTCTRAKAKSACSTSRARSSKRRIRTQPDRFAELLGERSRARILIEASTESEWVARCLEALGHEVIVADPNFALMYATRSRRVKTDRRDAQALMDACRLGAYRPAHRTSDAQRQVRAELAVRDALVRTRARFISLMRTLLRREGLRVRSGMASKFPQRVAALSVPGPLSAGSPR